MDMLRILVTFWLGHISVGCAAEFEALSLKGRWQIVNEKLDTIGLVIVWEFTDTEVIVREVNSGEEFSRARYKIDKSKSPNWITVEIDDSASGESGDSRLGIFQIEGAVLRLKQEIADGAARPVDLNQGFSSFKRVIDDKKSEQGGASNADR